MALTEKEAAYWAKAYEWSDEEAFVLVTMGENPRPKFDNVYAEADALASSIEAEANSDTVPFSYRVSDFIKEIQHIHGTLITLIVLPPAEWMRLCQEAEIPFPQVLADAITARQNAPTLTETLPPAHDDSHESACITGPAFAKLQAAIAAFDPTNPPKSKKAFMYALEKAGCNSSEQLVFATIAAEHHKHSWR